MQGDLERQINRLYADETLTSDVDDAPARALLEWAAALLREGKEEGAVRRLVRTVAGLVRDRGELNPEQIQQQLEGPAGSPWPAEKQALLSTLAAERASLPAAAWAKGLMRLVSTALPITAGPSEQASIPDDAPPAPSSPGEPRATTEGNPPSAARRTWWERILPWRRRL